jgi:hypothetical protein
MALTLLGFLFLKKICAFFLPNSQKLFCDIFSLFYFATSGWKKKLGELLAAVNECFIE